jgi:hypothetical protein
MTPHGAAGEDFELEIAGEPEINPVLPHKFATEFGSISRARRSTT